jgi:hypothetical protein
LRIELPLIGMEKELVYVHTQTTGMDMDTPC